MKFSNHFLQWFLSYVNDRRQLVQVNYKTSELIDTKFGVPQGSILVSEDCRIFRQVHRVIKILMKVGCKIFSIVRLFMTP